MAIELINEVAKILPIKQRKSGTKDDAPLIVTMKFELDIQASHVLAYFHPTLSHFLYDDNGVRFGACIKDVKWDEVHKNMQIDIAGLNMPLQAETIHKFRFWPYCKPGEDDRIFRDRIILVMEADIRVLRGEIIPLNLLSEMINTEVGISIGPSQLEIMDHDHAKPEPQPTPTAPVVKIKTQKANA